MERDLLAAERNESEYFYQLWTRSKKEPGCTNNPEELYAYRGLHRAGTGH